MANENLQGLINSLYVQTESDDIVIGPYNLSVILDNVLAQSQKEGDASYVSLRDILFGQYKDGVLGGQYEDFTIGEESFITFLAETRDVWEKLFYGIYAIVNSSTSAPIAVWNPRASTVNDYIKTLENEDQDIKLGEYLGSFKNQNDIESYVIIENEEYQEKESYTDEEKETAIAYKYRKLSVAEVARYLIDSSTPTSMIQRQAMVGDYWTLVALENYEDSNTSAIANKSDIESLFSNSTS